MSDVGRRCDVERAAVYEAEIAAFDGTDLERVQPVDQIIAVVDRLTAGDWWRSCADAVAGSSGRTIEVVSIVASRADARSSVAVEASGRSPQIRLAAPQTTVATVSHELAHVLAGLAEVHGPVFRQAYLDVVEAITNVASADRRGRLHVDQLAGAFGAAGLAVGEARWPSPAAAGPIVL